MDAITQGSIASTVANAIKEDVGGGDITAQLIPQNAIAEAELVCREDAVIAGQAWAAAVFAAIDPRVILDWQIPEGGRAQPDSLILICRGSARSILTAERTAMNFLQTLSATATATADLTQKIQHTEATLLDTRKTLPGLRLAQKYAVKLGGGENHRIGLFDAFLIKENHIMAAGGIGAAITAARILSPAQRIEVEVENLKELAVAIEHQPDWIMLDNFSLADLKTAVQLTPATIMLEASGGIETTTDLIAIAETGVNYISMGALTKHCRAIDLSLRVKKISG